MENAIRFSATEGTIITRGEILNFDKLFGEVRVDQLSMKDSFMKHSPTCGEEFRIKESIKEAKKIGMGNFYTPLLAPDLEKNNIVYDCDDKRYIYQGFADYMQYFRHRMPETEPVFWIEKFKELMPERNTRLGTQLQYDVFLGTLIKELVENQGCSVKNAWERICRNRKNTSYLPLKLREKSRVCAMADGSIIEEQVTRVICRAFPQSIGKWGDLDIPKFLAANEDYERFHKTYVGLYYEEATEIIPSMSEFIKCDEAEKAVGWLVMD